MLNYEKENKKIKLDYTITKRINNTKTKKLGEKMEMKNNSQKWPIILFTIGVFMTGLDNGIISTALMTIYESFGVSPSWGAWSITLYTLGIAISVPIIGKLSDNYGRRRLFIIEIALFGIGSLFVALSPNFIFLLIARFIQAIGGGGIFIIGSSHILATLPKRNQGKALGLLGAMHGLSAVIGPNLGAIILHFTGAWEWMFLINLPIAVFLIVFGYLKIPETKVLKKQKLDFKGTILLTLSILAFMLGITNLDGASIVSSLFSVGVLPLIILGIILFIWLVKYEENLEKRNEDPIFSVNLFKERQFQITLMLGLFSGGFLAGIIFIPSYVQQVLYVPVENAGFWLTPLALASGIGAGLGGFLTDKLGAKITVSISGVVGLIGFLMFPLFVVNGYLFVIASVISGVGLGMMLGAPLNSLVGETASEDKYGSALGTLSLMRQIGLTLFPTVFAGFMTSSVLKVEPTLLKEYGSIVKGIFDNKASDVSESYSYIMNKLNQLPDTGLQNEIIERVTTIFKAGYDQMFYTSAILSLFVLVLGIYLLKRKE